LQWETKSFICIKLKESRFNSLNKGYLLHYVNRQLDIDTTAALCTTSLHGTAASINQHPTDINQGTPREVPAVPKKMSESLKELPT